MTYSVVARDARTGQLGVAVATHWFAVGGLCPWVRPGVGAVATQSIVEPSYGPDVLDRLAAGATAQEALAARLAADDHAALRQVAVVDADGRVAVHTGDGCVAFAGHESADGWSCQANMMVAPGVWPAMAEAFRGSAGLPLAARLLAALDAAEAAGGDVRGRQSAALLVAPAQGEPWRRNVDLRVDDHPAPLDELRRLLTLHEAYALAGEADDLAAAARHGEAEQRYRAASALAPDNDELRFWAGLSAAAGGDTGTGVALVRDAIAQHAGWRQLLDALPDALAPGAAVVRRALDGS